MNAPANDQSKALADNLRVMFAAAAPAEIPDWFNPPKEIASVPHPGAPPHQEDFIEDPAKREEARTDPLFGMDGTEDCFQKWSDAEIEWRAKRAEYVRSYTEARYFAWRVYYANEMTARVVKEMGK